MKKTARLLALMLALMLCAVSTISALAEDAAPTAEPSAAPTADPNAVLVTVNGVGVTRETVDTIAANLLNSYSQYGYDTTDESFQAIVNQYALDYAVQLELMDQKAKEWGFDQFTDEEKAQMEADNAASWAEIVDQYVTYYGGLSAEATDEEKAAARVDMIAMLESMGYTEAVMLENAYENAKFDRVEAEMIKGAAVTDEEIQAAFDEKVKADEASYKDDIGTYEYMTQYYGQPVYYTPAGYRGITHILLEVDADLLSNYQTLNARLEEQQDEAEHPAPTADPAVTPDPSAEPTATPEPPVTQEEVDAAYNAIIASVQPTIDEINQKLSEGTPFAELVAEYGTDPGMEREPEKTDGYSVHMDSIVWDPAFVKAAFSVEKVGDVAAPVVGSYGVHIVQYTRDVPSGAVEFTEEVKNTIQDELLSQKENELFESTINEWKSASVIAYSEEAQAMLPAADEAE